MYQSIDDYKQTKIHFSISFSCCRFGNIILNYVFNTNIEVINNIWVYEYYMYIEVIIWCMNTTLT